MGLDYYAILDVKRDASIWEIKMAYRKLALRLHPQRKEYQQHPVPRPEGVFDLPLPALSEDVYWELLNEAFDVLSNDLWREIFNLYGEEGLKRGTPAPNGFAAPYVYHKDCMLTFYDFFGSYSPYCDLIDAATNPPPLYRVNEGVGVIHKNPDIVKYLNLTLEEVYQGCIKVFKFTRKEFVDEWKTATEDREVSIAIPIQAGCMTGTRIVYAEYGDQTVTRSPADIVFVTFEEPHPIYTRENVHLHMRHEISLKQALTGFKMTVETLDGRKLEFNVTDIAQ
jgi:DnaJ family protein B protein 13